jgi:PKHD-type hydroxylase
MILTELERHPLFLSAALPRHVFPPLFNRYAPGMSFGPHIDNAIRQIPGTPHRIRTDLSATIFLADPHTYEGGELIIQTGDVARAIKLPAGHMVLYSAGTLHHVTPVTSGQRLAAFFWVQSLVKDPQARATLFEMDDAIRELSQQTPDAPALVRLTGCYHNLIRAWAEL